jgi:hypothetical protein
MSVRTVATNRPIVHLPGDIWVWRAMMEWYWQKKAEELREKPVPVSLCPPQISYGLTWVWTQASMVWGRQQTAWAMAWPLLHAVNSMCQYRYITVSIEQDNQKQWTGRIGEGKSQGLVTFHVLKTARVKITAFWDIAPCSLIEVDRHFRGMYCSIIMA